MTSITKLKRLTLTERHEIVLRLDKGHPLTAIANDYGVKKLTYLIILTMTSKIYFLRSGMRNTVFLTFFRANGVSKNPGFNCII